MLDYTVAFILYLRIRLSRWVIMEQMIEIFKSFSEEIRLRMLLLLVHGELCVCELMAVFDEPQSKVSRHLAYLKRSGLVKSRRVGAWMHYSLNESLDEPAREQLVLLQRLASKNLSFQNDYRRMKKMKPANLCETQACAESVGNKKKKSGTRKCKKEKVSKRRK